MHVLRRESELKLDLTSDYTRGERVPIASGDQILVGRKSGFNLFRDLVLPLASLAGTVAAIINVTRR